MLAERVLRFASRVQKLWRETDTRENKRLFAIPRYTPTTTQLFGRRLQLVDGGTFVVGKAEIFDNEIYKFEAIGKSPVIIDCGANIGLSVIYFKRRHPKARVIAFEADPGIFEALRTNVDTFGLEGVELRNEAVWTSKTLLPFHCEGGASGRILGIEDLKQAGRTANIETARLRDILAGEEAVEFLKMDIEGAETSVLADCVDQLHKVRNLFVEYHSIAGRRQILDELLVVLGIAGFRYYIKEAHCPASPFETSIPSEGMDLQLNIFAVRPT